MKALLVVTLLWGLAAASPVLTGLNPWPDGTVIYHASGVALESVSAITFDKKSGKYRATVKFRGEWQINPDLLSVDLKPQGGIVVCADTIERNGQLQKLRDRSLPLRSKKVDIFVYGGADNNDRITYAYPEQIKIVPAGSSK